MNFPKFPAKGEHDGFICWRWSNSSLNEAQQLAAEAATLGNQAIHPELQPLVALHDETTRAASQLPLA